MLVTKDDDFLLRHPPDCSRLIWLRCGNQPTSAVEALLRRAAPAIAAFEADPEASCLQVL